MNEFWYTSQTMRAIKGATYRSFELLSPTHLFWLGLTLLMTIWTFTWFKMQDPETKTKAFRILTVLLLADEIFKYVVTLATGQFEWQFLPFHLCSINLFVCLWNTLRPNTTAKEILYTICIPAALIALLTPAWMPLPILNFMHLHSATVHIMLLLYPLMLLADGFRPNIKNIGKVLIFLVCAAILAAGLNALWGTNFMFLSRTDNNPMLNLVANIFGKFYVLGMGLLVIVVLIIMYLPWVIPSKKKA